MARMFSSSLAHPLAEQWLQQPGRSMRVSSIRTARCEPDGTGVTRAEKRIVIIFEFATDAHLSGRSTGRTRRRLPDCPPI